ncbi:hypothetical protein F8271_05180 [Micromonospora sp. ALFpr18c]|uniref:hypothetical protein n=1 Tax=unclassified Micromonospora TaxID=2617518 RepID=UPI00124B6CF8|nr:hypothetical protein [Micromonospora sp. ALFpr18c]KAB1947054.1 hypothetical protein F8271_05180 [Micromonospora sp. ALFpr18c]
MTIKTLLKSVTAGAAVAAMLSTAALTATAAPAEASMGKGRYLLCSQANYWSYVRFYKTPTNFNWSSIASIPVEPGTCRKGNIPSSTSRIEVVGWNPFPELKILKSVDVSAASNTGIKFFSKGNTSRPYATYSY